MRLRRLRFCSTLTRARFCERASKPPNFAYWSNLGSASRWRARCSLQWSGGSRPAL